MKKLLLLVTTTLMLLLSGCNGSSGDNPTANTEPAVAAQLTLTLLNSQGQTQQSFEADENLIVQAKVTDQYGEVYGGLRVDFSTDLGTLSKDSALSNSDGIASIEITNANAELGAGTLTVNAAGLSENIDFEFINQGSNTSLATLNLQMKLNGELTNQFKVNEQVQVAISLTDSDDNPIADQIINVTADIGSLLTASTLTNGQGQASVTLSGDEALGAGVLTVTLADNIKVTKRMNYQILPADSTVLDDIRIGYVDQQNQFHQGEIGLSIADNTVSAGGTVGLFVDLLDSNNQRVGTPTSVTFTSNCVLNETATIDQQVFSIKGSASATFEDINCAGVAGTQDVIVASVTANGVTSTASATINISGEQLGSIEFISAEPDDIVIKGSGGTETSTLTFQLKSALGNAIAQHKVDFSLDSSIGGIALSRESGYTNSQGIITTQVSSGTVPTVVRVTAIAEIESDGESGKVQTQSSELSINTGLPEQASMTIAASVLNPEADTNTIGKESSISVWLADSFNNPVPDGTTVNFTTEGGNIEPSCNTVSGHCSVTWTATEPYLADHRSTILATTSGHETFFDSNGNNIFDDQDGNAISNSYVNSGSGRQSPVSSGFVDMSEAWRDDNENRVKDAFETKFYDDNGDGEFSIADGKFNGPQCTGSKCDSNAKKSTLRKSLVLIMASAFHPNYILSDGAQTITYQDNNGTNNSLPDVADGNSLALSFRFADSQMQTMPIGTTVSVALEGGELQGNTSIEIGNTSVDGFREMAFLVKNPVGGEPDQATLTITIDTPDTLPTTYITRTINLL